MEDEMKVADGTAISSEVETTPAIEPSPEAVAPAPEPEAPAAA